MNFSISPDDMAYIDTISTMFFTDQSCGPALFPLLSNRFCSINKGDRKRIHVINNKSVDATTLKDSMVEQTRQAYKRFSRGKDALKYQICFLAAILSKISNGDVHLLIDTPVAAADDAIAIAIAGNTMILNMMQNTNNVNWTTVVLAIHNSNRDVLMTELRKMTMILDIVDQDKIKHPDIPDSLSVAEAPIVWFFNPDNTLVPMSKRCKNAVVEYVNTFGITIALMNPLDYKYINPRQCTKIKMDLLGEEFLNFGSVEYKKQSFEGMHLCNLSKISLPLK